MHTIIYEDKEIYIEKHESELPWVKIFTQEPYKELGDMPKKLRTRLWNVYDIVEFHMKFYYKPDKINMASFANKLPRVHIHVIARFESDSWFPNTVWEEKVRESNLNLPDEDKFFKELHIALTDQAKNLVTHDRRSTDRRR
ncbi:HIT domain-containing protein [Sulfurimonas sp.]|uniref:HIT domain-containing protein n=1 Tax=Sulfurimonas sp. TaxID=2022749 RepID=UPI00356698E2